MPIPVKEAVALSNARFAECAKNDGMIQNVPSLDGPADNVLGGTIKEISQSFSDANNIPVNITQIRGREMAAKEASKNKSDADIVILEKTFPLFNLSGMDKLENKKLINNCTYLYSEKGITHLSEG